MSARGYAPDFLFSLYRVIIESEAKNLFYTVNLEHMKHLVTERFRPLYPRSLFTEAICIDFHWDQKKYYFVPYIQLSLSSKLNRTIGLYSRCFVSNLRGTNSFTVCQFRKTEVY